MRARIGRLLLRLYSRAFRRAHGPAALQVLEEDLLETRRAGGGGLPRRILLWAEFAAHGLLDRSERVVRAAAPGSGFWNGWSQDVRVALRSSRKRLGFTTVAVGSLAIGLGINAVVFAVTDTFFLRDIPGVTEPDALVELALIFPGGDQAQWNVPDFQDVTAAIPSLEAAALFDRGTVSFATDGEGEQLLALHVTSGYFRTMGAPPAMGRDFGPEVDRAPGTHPEVVLSHRTWTERFDADPGIVGATVRLNREPYTVIGVASETFRGHQFGLQPAVYLPLTQSSTALRDPERFFGSRGTLWVGAVGRMAPGTSLDQLNATLRTVTARLAEAHPDSNTGRSAHAFRASLMPTQGRLAASVAFGLIGGLMLLVLAATAANVGGMLLARASAREREMAVRMALGSGRARMVRHLVTEAMVVFLLGGTAGLVLATQGLRWFEASSALPTFLPVQLDFALDGRIFAFGLGLTGIVGLVFGLLPALGVTRGGIQSALREAAAAGGDRGSRLRRVFVAGQVAVAILLLASSTLVLRSLRNTASVDPGFAPEGVYLTGFDLAMEGYEDPEEAAVFVESLLARIRSLPEVTGATVADDFPLDGGSSSSPVHPGGIGGPDARRVQSYYARVADGYFETLDIPRVAGRTFDGQDRRGTPRVAVVNEVLADALWPGESPLGREVIFGLQPHRYEVVGVVAVTNTDLLTDRPSPQIFTLLQQDPESDLQLAVRMRNASPEALGRVRREILALDPALALSPTLPLSRLAALALLPQRLIGGVAGVLGVLALFLSALGVYGVVAFMVARRTREIGVRMALGSSRAGVLRRVLLDGLRLGFPGVLVGIPLAVLLSVALRSLLVGVGPLDPGTWIPVGVVLVAVLSLASLAPARRASRVQPMEALRSE